MSIKTRVEKLESSSNVAADFWLRVVVDENDTDDVIERLQAEAVAEWLNENPGKPLPQEVNWIICRIIDPPMREAIV